MKTVLLVLGSLVSSILFAQNTTQEEYNFMTKGYRQLVESGLDMKKGYSLADTAAFSALDGKYEFTFMSLIRTKDRSLAGTIVVVNSNVWSNRYYLGMIAAQGDGSIDLQSTLMNQISGFGWDANIKTAFVQALSEYLSLLITNAYAHKANR